MPRIPRGQQAGFVYHVINRGNGRATIFHKPQDYQAFLSILAVAKARHPVRMFGFSQMPNHFHFVIEASHHQSLSRLKARNERSQIRTPMKRQWTSSKTILATLCHEFMHHLDVTALGFPNSFHTIGFYERTHRLYLAAIGHPYYPLKWRRVGFEGRQIINWQETKRLGAKVLGRTKARVTSGRRVGPGQAID